MGIHSVRNRFLLLFLLAAVTIAPFTILHAQKSAITLSVAVPEYIGNNLTAELFSAFEAEHPDVTVNLVKSGNDTYFAPAAYDATQFFNGAEKYVSSADVLFMSSYNLSVEMTRAGYVLDLAPLVNGDTSLDPDDFVPALWQSFQWDRGIWALPVTANVVILTYDPAAFDKAGLAYPDGKWTVDDLANAIRKLAQKDEAGNVTLPGILAWEPAPLFRSLLGEGFYDSAETPNPPQLDKPGLVALLDTWSQLYTEGLTGRNFRDNDSAVPMRVEQPYLLANQPGEGKPRRGSLLPGGKAGVDPYAFAVSSGTQHPDLAYALAKFMTREPKIVQQFFGLIPARKSLFDAYKTDDGTRYVPKFPPENQAVIDQALANLLPLAETRYGMYINKALSDMQEKKIDTKIALQAAQANATTILKTAADKRATKTVSVATPVPTPVLKAGEVSIKFNLLAYISPLPNRDQWDQVIKAFISSDPQVRQVVFDTGFNGNIGDLADKSDCFALPFNAVSDTDLSKLLTLDPLLGADSDFDKSDVIGNTLTQLQRDNKTWGYPLYIQPAVLRYNTDLFTKAGVKLPDTGWTMDAFNDAVKALKVNPGDSPPFVPRDFGNTYLLMLIAANGGLPLDYRTNPITVKFTEPATLDAMRQMLDLAKKGYIKYQKLAAFGGGGGIGGPVTDPIYTDSLSLLNFRSERGEGKDPYRLINYPKGSKFTPAAYTIGAAYISAKAANPEACYRWISAIAKHPELFSAMPARRSLLDAPGTVSQGADIVAYYKQFMATLQDPNLIIMSASQDAAYGAFILQYFLNRAFDRYVLDNADLDAELKQAETFATAYQGCIASIPPNTATTLQEQRAYFKQYTDCAIKVDPSLKSMFEQLQ
ncbi:MAG: extracellular solute-binding protein [Anaerolineae bacterium]|nr:extracellular solute-binding protein [Anaerolineae bacterium]